MKQETALRIADLINFKYSNMIGHIIEKNLGVKTTFIATVDNYGRPEYYVNCKAIGNEVNDMMTSNALLAQLFSKVWMIAKVFFDEETNIISFGVDLKYEHNYDGGSNGHSIMDFSINLNNDNVVIRK